MGPHPQQGVQPGRLRTEEHAAMNAKTVSDAHYHIEQIGQCFGVSVSIDHVMPTLVASFPTRNAAEIWIDERRRQELALDKRWRYQSGVGA
jgi:hypothetical protein